MQNSETFSIRQILLSVSVSDSAILHQQWNCQNGIRYSGLSYDFTRVTVAESVFYDNRPKNLIPSSITPADQFRHCYLNTTSVSNTLSKWDLDVIYNNWKGKYFITSYVDYICQ